MADGDLAFAPLTELSRMIREKKISPVELTHLHLARAKRLDPLRLAVITLTEENH